MSDQPSKPVEYRPVKGFPGYRVGDDGSFWSFRTNRKWKRLKGGFDSKGRIQVWLRKKGTKKIVFLHHLVLLSFGKERPSQRHVSRHLNGINTDNRLSNLKWGTQKENMEDRDRHGKTVRGEKHHLSKLTQADVFFIRASRLPVKDLAKMFCVHLSVIYAARTRGTWKHIE